jgi:hypothetical protein
MHFDNPLQILAYRFSSAIRNQPRENVVGGPKCEIPSPPSCLGKRQLNTERILQEPFLNSPKSQPTLPDQPQPNSIKPKQPARNLVTVQALVLEIERPSWISTRSPSLYSASACAWYFFDTDMYLPYISCLTLRSISTVTVFCVKPIHAQSGRPGQFRRTDDYQMRIRFSADFV